MRKRAAARGGGGLCVASNVDEGSWSIECQLVSCMHRCPRRQARARGKKAKKKKKRRDVASKFSPTYYITGSKGVKKKPTEAQLECPEDAAHIETSLPPKMQL